MDIGTAKPTRGRAGRGRAPPRSMSPIPTEEWSVQRTQAAARAAIADIEARGQAGGARRRHRPLRAGGGRRSPDPADRCRACAPRSTATPTDDAGLAARVRAARRLDPAAAARMEPGNRRRIVRALEVIELTGRPFSSFGPGSTRIGAPAISVTMVGIAFAAARARRAHRATGSTAMRDAGPRRRGAGRSRPDALSRTAARGHRLPRAARASWRGEIPTSTTRSTPPCGAPGSSPAASGCGSGATRGSAGSTARRSGDALAARGRWHAWARRRTRSSAATP